MGRTFTAEQIVPDLRQDEVLMVQCKTVLQAAREGGITETVSRRSILADGLTKVSPVLRGRIGLGLIPHAEGLLVVDTRGAH
jgi:hypothetical protein